MTNTPTQKIDGIIESQRAFFAGGATLDIRFRKDMLRRFAAALKKWEKPLCDALWTDLHKSYEEAYLTELSIVASEVKCHLRHVSGWSRRERRPSPLKLFPSRSYVVKEPLGNALIVSPWNYPVQLLLNPLVGAVSSGCTALLKPSPYVPHVSRTIEDMITDTFPQEYVAVVQGNREVNSYLFGQKFDIIFFTGSPALGRKVMAAAAKNLTPVVLELGGKSPCIVDRTADIRTAARRIAWGKTLNCGQTCIAPDYLILHKDIKDEFIEAYSEAVKELHGEDIMADRHYVRMVSDKAFDRVTGYFSDGTPVYGGESDRDTGYIAPTILDNVSLDSPVMNEEIFGPVFPIVTFDGEDFIGKAAAFVNSREKPLAFYYFGKEKDGWDIIRRTSSGGGCINDVIMHIASENIPFGGVGNSGLGRYHARESFEAFTHRRSIIATGTFLDLPFRYMPYKMFSLVKRIL